MVVSRFPLPVFIEYRINSFNGFQNRPYFILDSLVINVHVGYLMIRNGKSLAGPAIELLESQFVFNCNPAFFPKYPIQVDRTVHVANPIF